MQQRGDGLSPFATTIVEHLIPVLQSPMGTVPRSLMENCAITLGRVSHPLASALLIITVCNYIGFSGRRNQGVMAARWI